MDRVLTVAELRGEIASRWKGYLYKLAAEVDVNPSTFSAMLHERCPLPPQVAIGILRAIERQQRDGVIR